MDLKTEKLIKECQKGNLEKFGELYEIYFEKIYRYLYFRTSHKETAEDLTSQTFFKALNNIKSFGQKDQYFTAWLYTIARNSLIDYYRTKKTSEIKEDFWGVSSKEDVEEGFERKEMSGKIKDILNKLTPEQRDIVIMRIWDEMPYREIAKVFGKNEGAIKMAFSRAIANLRGEGLTLIALMLAFSNYQN